MSNSSGQFKYDPSELFAENLSQIQRKDPTTFKRIKDVVDRLLKNPGIFEHYLHGDKSGKLIKYVGRNLVRIVYNWCGNCRKMNATDINRCDNCDTKPDKTLRLFDVFYKHDANKLGY